MRSDQLTHPDVIQFIQDHKNDDPASLALQAKHYPDFPIPLVAQQIKSRQKVHQKLQDWVANPRVLFPPVENLEQASSLLTARFKARHWKGTRFVDLTAGTGVDAFSFSHHFEHSELVEPSTALCELLRHNAEVFGLQVHVLNTTAESFLEGVKGKTDLIYIDPSRRNRQQQRVVGFEDASPNVLNLLPTLLRVSTHVLIKASPMIDLRASVKQLGGVSAIHLIAVKNEMKEVLFHLSDQRSMNPKMEAWDLLKDGEVVFECELDEEKEAVAEYGVPGKYIYIPNAAVMKSGAYKICSERFQLKKLHPNTHVYTSDTCNRRFPGRVFQVKDGLKPDKKAIRSAFPDGKVHVLIRNYPSTSKEIKQRYKLHDGGEHYLICCRAGERHVMLWCNLV
ncbi:MAG: class I SAM-dependent methyltransferase [Bacteroidota bacterium]